MPCSPEDEGYMKRVLLLARRGMGKVSPNPMVGAVVVRSGVVIADWISLADSGSLVGSQHDLMNFESLRLEVGQRCGTRKRALVRTSRVPGYE